MKYFYRILNAEMPDKEDVKKLTPNPATRQVLARLEEEGIETSFDRHLAQQPQCGFGLRGICCQRCLWGPCRVGGPKKVKGICGADQNTVVMGNLLRGLSAGCAAHGQHAREVIETAILTAEGKTGYRLAGEAKILELAGKFGLKTKGKSLEEVAGEVGHILLEDLSRVERQEMKTLLAFAPKERIEKWRKLGIMPRSAMYEVFESLHKTTLGGDSDWQDLARQELRTALAYCWSTLFGSSLATEMLFGVPRPRTAEVNYGILKKDHVNILVHGHSPPMVEKVLEKINTPEIQQLAASQGAKGIQLAGMCCTGLELLARHGVPAAANILGQELLIGTGAVDAVIVDMQCVLPGMKNVADCFGTEVITTSDSNRIPGATHLPFDPLNADEVALEVARTAVSAFGRRDRSKINIPDVKAQAMAGFSLEAILDKFGGRAVLLELLKSGRIRGIVTVVGCNNTKVPYESSHVTIARRLIENNILVTTTGCGSQALLNAGLCAPAAAELAGTKLKEVCLEKGIPPVLPVGACVDNTRTIRLFIELAEEAGLALPQMPFAFSGPEPGNEKTLGQAVTFLTLGISVHQGFPGPIPVPIPAPAAGAQGTDDLERGSNEVADFFAEGIAGLLGSRVFSEPYPELAAKTLQMHIHRQRLALGWR
ncbi:MAG: anaerobic carbon-monoxide dehydrogenase catalytic subunit [Chloroflexota bacterium]